MPILATPLALAGLAAVPVLAGIYLLRRQSTRQVVSSLMLWRDEQRSGQGGLKVQRLRHPLLFFLELLAIVLLVLAAAGPRVPMSASRRPLVVVLDDSFSMLAGGDDSPRGRGEAAVLELADDPRHRPIRLIAAGMRPRVIGDAAHSRDEVKRQLDEWTCASPGADIDAALSFGAALGATEARLAVVTDRAPPEMTGDTAARLRWLAFGQPAPNMAIVAARRRLLEGRDRLLVEVANLSDAPAEKTLRLEERTEDGFVESVPLNLGPGGRSTRTIDLPGGTGDLRVSLDDDILPMDNDLVLAPPRRPPVAVQLSIGSAPLRELFRKALDGTGGALLRSKRPDLLIVDTGAGVSSADNPASLFPKLTPAAGHDAEALREQPAPWIVRVVAEDEETVEAYVGPFVIDREHPLTEGLSLEGTVWAAGDAPLPGHPLIAVGNIPLVIEAEPHGRARRVAMRYQPALSSLHQTPNWPILVSNIVRWRRSALPGVHDPNVPLGADIVFTPPHGAGRIRVTPPGRDAYEIPADSGAIAIPAEAAGRYRIEAGGRTWTATAWPLDAAESDLRPAGAGAWGDWLDESVMQTEYRSMAWVLLLAALAVLATHQYLSVKGFG